MRLQIAGDVLEGWAVDLSSYAVTGEEVYRAIRGESAPIHIACDHPGPVHKHVGHIHTGIALSRRSALAAAARANGYSAPQERAVREMNAKIDELEPPAITVRAARKRVAETGAECERLQESIAAQRGRVQALRDLGEAASLAETKLRDTITALSEQETERLAAEQALATAEQQARQARDQRERRLRLEDRVANLQRAARQSLAAQITPEFAQAKEAVPRDIPEPVADALAIARVAAIRVPIVLAEPWFETPDAAADWLGAPVIRL